MSNQRIKIPRQSDKKLWATFCKLAEKYDQPVINVSALGFVSLNAIDISEPSVQMKTLLSKSSSIIDSMTIPIPGYSIKFVRGGEYAVEQKSGVFDEIVFSQNNQNQAVNVEDKIDIVSFVNSELNGFDTSRAITSDQEAQAQLEAIHISTLERLETLNEELISKSAEFRQKVEEEYATKSDKLEEAFDQKAENLKSEYKVKKSEVEALRSDLKQKIKQVDDRNNTHVRRGLREDIQKVIQSRSTEFELTQGTKNLRWPIHVSCVLLLLVFIAGGAFYAYELFQYLSVETPEAITVVILAVKQLGLTLGAVGTSVFYLRWLNRWFEQHSRTEFQLKQFQLDIDRASWVVETALEWKTSLGSPIPTVLLESITKNLFETDQNEEVPMPEAGDVLASTLLGSASKVSVQTTNGGAELEFEGKKLKKKMAKN